MPRRFGRWVAVLVASSVTLLAPVPMLTPTAQAAEPGNATQGTVAAYLTRNPSISAHQLLGGGSVRR